MSEKINRAHIENMEEWERQVRKTGDFSHLEHT